MSALNSISEEEQKLAKYLVSPDEKIRNNAIKALESYIKNNSKFDDLDMLKLWKALYYCYWYSDKSVAQLELANALAKFIHKFKSSKFSFLFFRMFLRTILREWHFIDQYRINKFYNLIRFILRESFIYIKSSTLWNENEFRELLEILEEEILNKTPNGVRFHVAEIFLPELLVASEGIISDSVLNVSLHPFYRILKKCEDNVFVDRVIEKIFLNFATKYSVESESLSLDSSDNSSYKFINVSLEPLRENLFEAAAEESTRQSNRQKIYEIHNEYKKIIKLNKRMKNHDSISSKENSKSSKTNSRNLDSSESSNLKKKRKKSSAEN